MKFIYVHHAERDKDNNSIPRQEQDITENGKIEANLLADKIHHLSITKIYTSPYKRCIHTAEILNKNIELDIIQDNRLNEIEKDESFTNFLERNISLIKEVQENSNENDTILFITSGMNLSAFVCYFTKGIPNEDSLRCQGITLSPVLFSTDKRVY